MADAVERSQARGLRQVARGFGLAALGAGGLVVLVLATFAVAVSRMDWDFELGPGDGKDSERLAVDVTPRTGLTDGGLVRVTSGAFSAGSVIGLTVCLRDADTERRGADACDSSVGSRFAVPPDGHLDATFTVARVITIGGIAHDCAAVPCLVVAANVTDYNRSGGQEIQFAPGLPPADLTNTDERARTDLLPISGEPAGAVTPGTTLSVTATGLVPGEPVLVALCTSDFLRVDPWEACTTDDISTATMAMLAGEVGDVDERAGPDGSFTTQVTVPRSVKPIGDFSAGPSPTAAACTAAPGECAVVIAAAADTKRSAYLPLTVAN